MIAERLTRVLLAPIVSEKSTSLAESTNQIAFKVATDATKFEIKAAIKYLFKVDAEQVRVINVKGKKKRFGKIFGSRKDSRKAYITLKAGQEINFAETL